MNTKCFFVSVPHNIITTQEGQSQPLRQPFNKDNNPPAPSMSGNSVDSVEAKIGDSARDAINGTTATTTTADDDMTVTGDAAEGGRRHEASATITAFKTGRTPSSSTDDRKDGEDNIHQREEDDGGGEQHKEEFNDHDGGTLAEQGVAMVGTKQNIDQDKEEEEMKKRPKQSSHIETAKKEKKQRMESTADMEASYVDHANTVFNEISGRERSALQLYHEDTVGGPFPIKLQILLKVVEKLGKQHIIAWLPHGRSFIIHRPREFERDLMGQFFNNTKFSSFKRQLNLYDFKRVTHGANGGSYYHELFLRGKPLLATKMVRRKIKGNLRLASAPTRENGPEFYSMPFLGPASISDYPQDDFNSFNMLASRAREQHNPTMFQPSIGALHALGTRNADIMDHHQLSSSSMLSRLQQHQGGLGFQPTIPSDPLLLNPTIGNASGQDLLQRGLSDIRRSSRPFGDDPTLLRDANDYREHLGSMQGFSQSQQRDTTPPVNNLLDSLGSRPHQLQQHQEHLLANNSSISSSLSHRQQNAALQDHLLLRNQLLQNQLLQQMSSTAERSLAGASTNLLPHHLNDLTSNDHISNSFGGTSTQLPPSYDSNISNMTRAYHGLSGTPSSPALNGRANAPRQESSSSNDQETGTPSVRATMRSGYLPESSNRKSQGQL